MTLKSCRSQDALEKRNRRLQNRLKIDHILSRAGEEAAKPSKRIIRSIQLSMDEEAKALDDVSNKIFPNMYSGSPKQRYLSSVNEWRELHHVECRHLKEQVTELRHKSKLIHRSLI